MSCLLIIVGIPLICYGIFKIINAGGLEFVNDHKTPPAPETTNDQDTNNINNQQ